MIPTIKHNKPATLMLCLMLSFAAAAPAAMARGKNVDWGQLNLSPSQAQSINQLEGEWEQTYRELNTQIERDKAALVQELASPSPDPNKVMQLQSRIAQNKAALQNAATGVYLKKSKHLDAGQQKQLKQMMFSN